MSNQRMGDWFAVPALALAVRLATAALIPRPGYMDAAYYAAGALRLARGGGFSQPFIWNYLNQPAAIPTPGFLYWMPLPSLLAAPAAALFPGSFFALQVPFALLSALVPLVAYGLAWEATGRRALAWAAGLLAVFGGFFFPYWTLPETFAPVALFGSLALWMAGRPSGEDGRGTLSRGRWVVVGLLVGLAHLTRADALLLLPIAALAPLMPHPSPDSPQTSTASSGVERRHPILAFHASRLTRRPWKPVVRSLLLILLGHLLVMAPWFARNVAVTGAPLSPAGTKTVWLTEYDDLFCYGCDLSASSYLAWGWDNILRSKLTALGINLQRLLAEGGLVFLLPFALLGFYRLRRRLPYVLAGVYLVGIYLAHSLVFTFPGWRGGFFHASAAALPFLYAAGVEGLDAAVRWAAQRRRTWRYHQARTVFLAAAVAGAVVLSGVVAAQRIPTWRTADLVYEDVELWLSDRGAADGRVMVGNPPAFWYHAKREAVVVPNGDVEALLRAADQYTVAFVLLDANHPAGLTELYAGEADHPRLEVLNTWLDGAAILYAVER